MNPRVYLHEIGKNLFANDGTVSASARTIVWRIYATGGNALLGEVKWHSPWRCYSFHPEPRTLFERVCLRDLANFCETKTKEHMDRCRLLKQAARDAEGVSKIKYLVFPGYVVSKNDGDMHFISARQLIRLYGVQVDQCLVASSDPHTLNFFISRHHSLNKLINLKQDRSGNYKLPTH